MDEILYNVRLSTAMKNQILKDVSDIFEYTSRGDKKDELTHSVASCILALLILSRRCGIDISDVEKYMQEKINTGIIENHPVEAVFSDLSLISKYIRRN